MRSYEIIRKKKRFEVWVLLSSVNLIIEEKYSAVWDETRVKQPWYPYSGFSSTFGSSGYALKLVKII